MKTFDRILAVLLLLLACVHAFFAPPFHGHYDIAGMWFLSFGLMVFFAGLLNLARISAPKSAARMTALVANALALAFCIALAPLMHVSQNPQLLVVIIVFALETLFSLRRPA
jgi:uncharacterized membrane protein